MVLRALFGIGLTLLTMGIPAQRDGGNGGAPQVRLTEASPTADSIHHTAITEVRLRFSGPVQPTLSAVTVLGPRGAIPPTGPVEAVPGSDGTEVAIHFPEVLGDGAYTVEWRTAGLDGRVVRGSYAFSVAGPEPAPVASTDTVAAASGAPAMGPKDAQGSSTGFGPGGLTMNWFFLLSIVGMIGTVVFRLGVAAPLARREDLAEVAQQISRRLVRLGWVFAALGLILVPIRLLYQASALAGSGGEVSVSALFGTIWGSAWLLELASVALFLVALLLMGRESRPGPWLLALASVVLGAVVPGMSGHALPGGAALITVNTVHVLAAGSWAGGLACLVLVGIPAASSAPPESSALSAVAAAFSRIALPAVGILVLSGVVNASRHLGWGQLLTTPYGRLLSLKLVFVAGAFALGFYNWRMVRPALEGRPRTGLLSVPATLELVVALTVLAVTAALIVTAQP